jgi:hypothetical protein
MSDIKPEVLIKRWELDAIVIELIVLGGVATGVAIGTLSRFTALAHIPSYVLNGAGFAFLGVLLIPAQSVLVRVHRQHQISVLSSVVWCVIGAAVYIVTVRLMH